MEQPYQLATLPNGVRVVTETIPHVRSVAIGFWFMAGSRYEDPDINGISHFIEHMMFKGTGKRTARDIAEAMDALGGQLNAYTSKEYTCYYARVLDRHFSDAVEMLADMLLHSRLAKEDMDKEKGVILEEIKMYEDTPDELIHDLFTEAMLGGHPLGQTVLGKAETVQGLDRDDLEKYMERFYAPDALVVGVAGNIDHVSAVREIEKYFGALKGKRFRLDYTTPPYHPRQVMKAKATEQVHICVGTPGLCRHDKAKYPLFLVDTMVGGGASSRLFQELREERGLVYSTYSYHTCFQETGLFTVYAGTGPENAQKVLDIIDKELSRLGTEGFKPEELSRAKEQLKGNIMLSLESTTNRMSRLAKAVLFYDEIQTPDEVMALIDGVTLEQVKDLAAQMFRPGNYTVTAIGPDADTLGAGGKAGEEADDGAESDRKDTAAARE